MTRQEYIVYVILIRSTPLIINRFLALIQVEDILQIIRAEGYNATSIHGDKTQNERDSVLKDFRNGKSNILIATDVASRGLDVEDLQYVINYDYPNSSENYVHRIGRTGRCQQLGTAYTFFTPDNAKQARELISVLEEAGQTPSQALLDLARSMPSSGGYRGNKRWNNNSGGDRNTGGNNGIYQQRNNNPLNYQAGNNYNNNRSGPQLAVATSSMPLAAIPICRMVLVVALIGIA